VWPCASCGHKVAHAGTHLVRACACRCRETLTSRAIDNRTARHGKRKVPHVYVEPTVQVHDRHSTSAEPRRAQYGRSHALGIDPCISGYTDPVHTAQGTCGVDARAPSFKPSTVARSGFIQRRACVDAIHCRPWAGHSIGYPSMALTLATSLLMLECSIILPFLCSTGSARASSWTTSVSWPA
jgi:hypothetical protein